MVYQYGPTLSPANRHYRTVMARALAARHANDMRRYQQLMNEAEVLLRHIRQTSHLQAEAPHAQRAPH